MRFDWTTATKDQKKLLFEIAQRSGIARGLKWPEFTMLVFNRNFSDDDIDNCRAGRMGVPRCVALHNWMHENEPDLAHRLDVQIGAAGFPRSEVWLTTTSRTEGGGFETTQTLLRTTSYEPDGQRTIFGNGRPSERTETEGKFYDIHEDGIWIRVHTPEDVSERQD